MRWLIIEDSLESLNGHWYENLQGFHRELSKFGDELTIVVSRRAESSICANLGALPLLPESIPLRVSKSSKPQRLINGLFYFFNSYWILSRFLKKNTEFDQIYVSDATHYHLVIWVCLIKTVLRKKKMRALLFFLSLPLIKRGGETILDGSLISGAMKYLLHIVQPEIQAGWVVLGVETQALKEAAEAVFGLPFVHFPQGVPLSEERLPASGLQPTDFITMACFGPARAEKGSDILVAAIKRYLEQFPDGRVRFVFQWMEDFSLTNSITTRVPVELQNHPQVEIISRFIPTGEYGRRLAQTNVILLPYRKKSYGLRGSRVGVEAMVLGIPMIATQDTALHQEMQAHGTGLTCRDGDVESLVAAIREMELRYADFQTLARERQSSAVEHYSVRKFRDLLLNSKAN